MFKKILFCIFCILILSAFSCSFIKGKKIGRKDNMIKQFNLPNGMKVIVVENPQSKTVAMDIWVNTGSKDEPAEVSGVSHFLEHMLFKGTEKRKTGEIESIIEGVGGVTNAGTSMDFTHYYLTIPADKFDIGFDVLSDVIMNSSIDPEELERERQVILEEYRRKQDNPTGFLFDELYTNSYTAGGYERSVIGIPETINAITREKMINYYHERYIPKNMVFIIAGNVKLDKIKPIIENTFIDFKRGKDFIVPSTGEAKQIFGKNLEYKKHVNDTYFMMAFSAPGIENPRQTIIMDLLTTILSDGRSSRFFREIKENKQLVSNISASYPTLKGKSLFTIIATLKPEQKNAVQAAVLDEIKKVADKGISEDEFNKAKKIIKNSFLFGKETNTGIAGTLGYYSIVAGSTEYEENYVKELESISKNEIKQIASTFTADQMNTLTLYPEK